VRHCNLGNPYERFEHPDGGPGRVSAGGAALHLVVPQQDLLGLGRHARLELLHPADVLLQQAQAPDLRGIEPMHISTFKTRSSSRGEEDAPSLYQNLLSGEDCIPPMPNNRLR